ncbi:hypothetical protein D6817_04385 [Candidatus Pacearchaeota archaeon]|nr:MAG: hypothetical protein D6817_04385 [Candidatus Pacearchaeota archaeon]
MINSHAALKNLALRASSANLVQAEKTKKLGKRALKGFASHAECSRLVARPNHPRSNTLYQQNALA